MFLRLEFMQGSGSTKDHNVRSTGQKTVCSFRRETTSQSAEREPILDSFCVSFQCGTFCAIPPFIFWVALETVWFSFHSAFHPFTGWMILRIGLYGVTWIESPSSDNVHWENHIAIHRVELGPDLPTNKHVYRACGKSWNVHMSKNKGTEVGTQKVERYYRIHIKN